jgi:hypothetical protein
MDPVQKHVLLAIFHWVGLKPPAYGPSSALGDLWARVFGPAYLWKGVSALAKTLYQDPFFQGCPRAHELTPTMFGPGGGIQTVADLYIFLRPCAETEEAIDAPNFFNNPTNASDRA